jgi:hypothetical protein
LAFPKAGLLVPPLVGQLAASMASRKVEL